jgi:hypothetical protein
MGRSLANEGRIYRLAGAVQCGRGPASSMSTHPAAPDHLLAMLIRICSTTATGSWPLGMTKNIRGVR